MTLTVHRAERSDVLVQQLGDLLAEVPADPFPGDTTSTLSFTSPSFPAGAQWLRQAQRRHDERADCDCHCG